MSYLSDYCTAVLDGRIVSCEKLKRECEKLLTDAESSEGRWHFDEAAALKHIGFIERFCRIPSGKVGAPFNLELFQKAQLEAAFGFVDDNNIRKFNEVLIIEGRKNGKSSLLSAVLLDMLCNDHEGAPQCVTAATKKDQANITLNAARKMIRLSPALRSHIRKRTSDYYFAPNMGTLNALSSNTNSLDGLDLSCCVIDELSALKNRDLYDLMKQAMSARRQPMLFCISTNGFVRESIFDAQYDYASKVISGEIKDEHFLPMIYELDKREEWADESKWIKANPGLGTVKSIEYLKQCVEKAKRDDTFLPTVLVKDFNLKESGSSAWLTWDELANDAVTPEDAVFKYGIGGMDAADSVDLNAAKLICKRPDDDRIYVKSMYWIPESKLAQTKDRHHPDDAPYDIWISRGLMRVAPGNRVDKRVFLDWFREMRDEEDIYPMYIGFDPWHIDQSLLADFENEFGKSVMIPIRQGVKTLSQPMKDLKAEFQAGHIVYDKNPIDRWCLANTYTRSDVNGNIQPDKGTNARHRIDGTAALLNAFCVYEDKRAEYESML